MSYAIEDVSTVSDYPLKDDTLSPAMRAKVSLAWKCPLKSETSPKESRTGGLDRAMMLGLHLPTLQSVWTFNEPQQPTRWKPGPHTVNLGGDSGTIDWWGLFEVFRPLGHALGGDSWPLLLLGHKVSSFTSTVPMQWEQSFMDHNLPNCDSN